MHFNSVTCPHCGLLCDDLSVDVDELSIRLLDNVPPLCAQAFQDASFENTAIPSPTINGTNTTSENALLAAVEILQKSKQALVSGLIGDVQTCREAIALTEKLGGVIDHANGSKMRASSAIMQRFGEVKTTLAEVRNRADCVVIIGSNVLENFPRLYERILSPEKSLGTDTTTNKKIFVLDTLKNYEPKQNKYKEISYLNLDVLSLEECVYLLAGVVNSKTKVVNETNQVAQELQKLYQFICKSQYTSLIWSTAEFQIKTVEQTIQAITQLIKKLMLTKRVVGLSLSGSNAEITANQVTTWQTGVPLPIAFMNGSPTHDPNLYDGMKMLQNHEADSLVWIASYNSTYTPPKTDIPTIVIGHPKMQCASNVNVFIPIGVPGIDHCGLACRTDSVATLPLKSIRTSNLAAASEVIRQLTQLI